MYTPEQQATRYHNASTKLGAITDTLSSLCDREHGEGISTWAGTTLYYLNQLCEQLDRKAVQLRAGHTMAPRNTLRGTHVYLHCICGYETESDDKLIEHISYMVSTVGETNAAHKEAR